VKYTRNLNGNINTVNA